MDCRVLTIAGSDQTLSFDRDLCLALRQDTLELLHHVTQRGACLLHRLPKGSLFLAGRDDGGDPLDHGLTVEQNESTARDQQENGKKTNSCNSHNSPSNVHVDDLANNQSTCDGHPRSGIQKLDANSASP